MTLADGIRFQDDTADEVLEVDGPTSRPYIAQGGPIPAGLQAAERDERELIVPAKPKPEFYPLCFEAYADRRYSDICKSCTPRMGVRP